MKHEIFSKKWKVDLVLFTQDDKDMEGYNADQKTQDFLSYTKYQVKQFYSAWCYY